MATQDIPLRYWCEEALPGVLYSEDYVKGLVFAVAAAPEIPMPEQWLPWVFKQHGQLRDIQQADALTDTLMRALQQQLKAMRDNDLALPAHYSFPEIEPDGAGQAPVSVWLSGVLAGHQLLHDVWLQAWQNMLDHSDNVAEKQRDLSHCLRMFSTFADVSAALQEAERANNPQLAEKLPQIFPALPRALEKYVSLSGELAQYLPQQFETFSVPNPLRN